MIAADTMFITLFIWAQVGFFKRKRLSEYQAARMSSRQQQQVGQQQQPEQIMAKSP